MALTAQQFADKWATNLGGATTAMTQGANGVTESPTAKAARRVDAQVAGVQRAAASGKTAAALNGVTLDQWRQAYVTKGIPRVATGATAAKPKMQAFGQFILGVTAQGKAQLDASMPRGDASQNRARMNAWMDYMMANRYKK